MRRILRRAVRYGRQILKAKSGFFSKLVPIVVSHMSDFFPELQKRASDVTSILEDEEKSFERTLDRGIEHFLKAAEKSKSTKIISGEDIFSLYDTFGFPIDLTQLMAAERGFTADVASFDKLMNQKRIESGSNASANNTLQLDVNATAKLNKELQVAPTDDSFKYVISDINATIKAIWNGSEFVSSVGSGTNVGIVFDKSNFYAEQGGQIFDVGTASTGSQVFTITNVQTYAGYVLHTGSLNNGEVKVGQSLDLGVDLSRRNPVMNNHTFTHIVNFALRSVLGSSVDQKGSLVDHEKLRFDFSHNKQLTIEELTKVEEICNAKIKENLSVYSKSVSFASAKKINGLRAVFGETYPDPVNVVSIGVSVDDLLANPDNEQWMNYSIEFCGGTHLKTTGAAKLFVIVSETGIAKGIRRLIAWTGDAAIQLQVYGQQFLEKLQDAKTKKGEELDKLLSTLQAEFDTASLPALLKPTYQKLLDELVALKVAGKKDAEKFAKIRAEEMAQKALSDNQTVIVEEMDVAGDRKAFSSAMLVFKEKLPNHAVFIAAKEGKKLAVMTFVAKPLQEKLSAGNWARDAVAIAGGKGGGKAESGQGSADSNETIADVLKKAKDLAKL